MAIFASHGGSRSASAAISICTSVSAPPAAMIASYFACSAASCVEVGVGLGVRGVDLLELLLARRARRRCPRSTVSRTVRAGSSCGSCGRKPMRMFGIGTASPSNSLSSPAMMPQQRRLAGAVQPEHADLGAGKERQRDVLEDDALGRHDLAHAVHRVNVLSHRLPVNDGWKPAIIAGRACTGSAGRLDSAGTRRAAGRPPFRLESRANGYFFAAAPRAWRAAWRPLACRARAAASGTLAVLERAASAPCRRRIFAVISTICFFFCAMSAAAARARRRSAASSRSIVRGHRLAGVGRLLLDERRLALGQLRAVGLRRLQRRLDRLERPRFARSMSLSVV